VARQSQEQRLLALLAKYQPVIRDVFAKAVQDIVDHAQVGRVVSSLERGDIEGALRALHIQPTAYIGLEAAVRQAYLDGGVTAVSTLPVLRDTGGARMVIRFDIRNPSAERWLAEHSSTLITGIVDDQREAVQAAMRDGLARGANPRSTALDIVGRVNPASTRREGGVLGLSAPQERYVTAARAELSSGDPTLMRHYLTRTRRDARFDGVVRKAIAAEKALDTATVARLIGRYADRLLQLRGETIARTETMASLHASQMEAHRQAIATGSVQAQNVRKVWKATNDNRTRDTHRDLHGQSVGLEERFANGLLYPGDPSGHVSEIVNCRCHQVFRIDFMAGLE
jgi:hypothetical protein